MRKFFFIAAIAIFSSCQKEETPIILTVENPSMSLFSKNKQFIGANTNSEDPITYLSSDEWVAKVDEFGVVEAGVIGTAEISVSNGITTQVCNVEVKPKFTIFEEPFLKFGSTKEQLKQALTTGDTVDFILFFGNIFNADNSNFYAYLYLFDDDEKLGGVLLLLNPTSSLAGNLLNYLSERYIFLGSDEDKYEFINKEHTMNVSVMMSDQEDLEIGVIFSPASEELPSSIQAKKLSVSKFINSPLPISSYFGR